MCLIDERINTERLLTAGNVFAEADTVENLSATDLILTASEEGIKKISITNLLKENNFYPQYGVCYYHNIKSPTLERVGAAAGLVAGIGVGSAEAINDFDNIYPWSEIRRCTLADDGTVTAYKGDANYTEDGSIGQVMVEIPKFYIKKFYDENADKYYTYICKEKLDGYRLPKAFENREGGEIDKIYVAAYFSKTDETAAVSKAGGYERFLEENYISTGLLHKRAANWHCMDAPLVYDVLQPLFIVEFATLNSESVFKGFYDDNSYLEFSIASSSFADSSNTLAVTISADEYVDKLIYTGLEVSIQISGNDTDYSLEGKDEVYENYNDTGQTAYFAIRRVTNCTAETVTDENGDKAKLTITFDGSPIMIDEKSVFTINMYQPGVTNNVIASSGICGDGADGFVPFVWRGMENPFSFYFDTVVYGVLTKSAAYYINTDIAAYGTSSSVNDYTKLSYGIPNTGYISALGNDENNAWAALPSETDGSSESGYCDVLTKPLGANTRFVAFGGFAAAEGGLFAHSTYVSTSSGSWARLAYRKYD